MVDNIRDLIENRIRDAFGIESTLDVQILHRIDLVNFWDPRPGSRILEIGCGPGDTTGILAAAVGAEGYVAAVEKGPAKTIWAVTGLPKALSQKDLPLSPAVEKLLKRYVCGSSTSPGTPMSRLLGSALGKQVTFHVCMDLLDSGVDFPEKSFDMAVFSHCSWYLETPGMLESLFRRVRPWAKRLAFAEWDIVPSRISQLPHFFAAMMQSHILSLCPAAYRDAVESGGGLYNIVSIITPDLAKHMAQNAGWTIERETSFDCAALQDGVWEGRVAHELADEYSGILGECARNMVETEQLILRCLERRVTGSSVTNPKEKQQKGRTESLSTYAFNAV